MTVATPAGSARPASPVRERLTIAAAAASVLAVLGLPPVLGSVVDVSPPVDRWPTYDLTDPAREIAKLPGAFVVDDSVVLMVTPETGAPVFRPEQQVQPRDAVHGFVTLGGYGILPTNPYLAPADAAKLTGDLWPGDNVFSVLGPLALGCLVDDTPGDCTATLVTRHDGVYYRYPRSLGSDRFLDDGRGMEAQILPVLGGQVVIGGLSDRRARRVVLTREDGSHVHAFPTTSVSQGDLLWWSMSKTSAPAATVATAYDADGRKIDSVDLNGPL